MLDAVVVVGEGLGLLIKISITPSASLLESRITRSAKSFLSV